MSPGPQLDERPVGLGARLKLALQVLAAATLACLAAWLVTWLAERPAFRWRSDWTAGRENTLSPASQAVLDRLGDDVQIDTFFTPLGGPLGPIGYEAQNRTLRLLVLLRDASGGRVALRTYDMGSQVGIAEGKARLQELGVRELEPGGIVAVSMGNRHSVLRLHGDLADIDPGDPRGEQGIPRPPRLVAFRAEEGVVSALLKVGLGDVLKVYVSTGHGERDLDDTGLNGLSQMRRGLEGDGFTVDRWNGRAGAKIPDDCAVLAVLGPDQPFGAAEADAIREFVDGGGRLVAAPGRAERSSADASAGDQDRDLAALLLPFGIRIDAEGIVAEPRATATGKPLYESPQCAEVRIGSDGLSASSPITEPLKRADRYVEMPFSRSLDRSPPPTGASVLTLLTTESSAWRDLPNSPTPTGHDWKVEPSERRGPFYLAMTSLFRPPKPSAPRKVGGQTAQPESRVLVLGSADAFANDSYDVNGDLILNAFDWAASREFRVHVEPRSRRARRLNLTTGRVLARVHLAAVVLLPGSCLVLGLLTWWRRKRR